jgi:hypothetical protein
MMKLGLMDRMASFGVQKLEVDWDKNLRYVVWSEVLDVLGF